jgi:hypothetical protein
MPRPGNHRGVGLDYRRAAGLDRQDRSRRLHSLRFHSVLEPNNPDQWIGSFSNRDIALETLNGRLEATENLAIIERPSEPVRLDQYYAMIGVETHQFGGRGNRNLTEPINHRAGDVIRACGLPPWPISSVPLPNSLGPIDQAQSPGTPKAVGA